MLACFSVANFAVGFYAKNFDNTWLSRLATHADDFWIGSIFFLLVLGFCQA